MFILRLSKLRYGVRNGTRNEHVQKYYGYGGYNDNYIPHIPPICLFDSDSENDDRKPKKSNSWKKIAGIVSIVVVTYFFYD